MRKKILLLVSFFYISIVAFYFIETGFADEPSRQMRLGFDISIFNENPNTTIAENQAAMSIWVSDIEKRTNILSTQKYYKDIDSIVMDLKNNKIDLVTTTPINYLEIAKQANVEIAYGNERKDIRYLLMVNHSINTIADLQHKKLCIRSNDQIGFLFINLLLRTNGYKELDTFFDAVIKKSDLSEVILSVFFSKADACVATDTVYQTMTELNPQVSKQIKVIDQSGATINIVSFFRADYPKELKEIVKREIFNLKNNNYSKQVLTLLKIKDILPLNDSDLDNIRDMMERYQKFISK
ncbi:MAG: PhnD/SsuA/transferrin family substrate-binding protein [Desulfobacterales bacterium]|nr:PhnD/SsuA/transferrin family substrate-binding protein [Desulfobacterales bacterium]